jgi:hypothetical protein
VTKDSMLFATLKFVKQFYQKKKSPSKQWQFSDEFLVVCKTKKERMFLCKRCVFANPLQE